MSLRSDIEAAIVAAWIDAPVVATAPRSEPNHVARLIGHASQPIADAIVANTAAKSATVRSTFCHQNPYAFWEDSTGIHRCELADLLIIVRTPSHERALLLQTKMRNMRVAMPWVPGHGLKVSGTATVQRALYAGLPTFRLEFTGAGGPTARNAREAGSVEDLEAALLARRGVPLASYALSSLPAATPAGLVYTGIDNLSPRKSAPAPWSPWLTEPRRPVPKSTRVDLTVTLAETLDHLIRKAHPDVGLSLDPPAHPDWRRLIEHLQHWADAWFRNPGRHDTNHGVTTRSGAYEPSAFDNLGEAFMCRAAAGGRAWSASSARHLQLRIDDGRPRFETDDLFTRTPFAPSTWIVGRPPPPDGGAGGAGDEGAQGFGIIELDVRFADETRTPVRTRRPLRS